MFKTIIDNFINGNLQDARKGAKRVGLVPLINALKNDYGMGTDAALAVAAYLKGQGTFQAACDAQHADKH